MNRNDDKTLMIRLGPSVQELLGVTAASERKLGLRRLGKQTFRVTLRRALDLREDLRDIAAETWSFSPDERSLARNALNNLEGAIWRRRTRR